MYPGYYGVALVHIDGDICVMLAQYRTRQEAQARAFEEMDWLDANPDMNDRHYVSVIMP